MKNGGKIGAASALLLILLACCIDGTKDNARIEVVEIREYEGQPLSSINDFRENSIKGPQYVDAGNYSLLVFGRVETVKEYPYDEALRYGKRTKVTTLFCVEGWNATILWEGISLAKVIDESKPTEDANTVIFHSYDGYTTSLSLDYIRERDIILAYKMNNATLIPDRGYPFTVVAEDKWGYKWAKWVVGIELSNDSEYRGYWESRGYRTKGDVGEPSLEQW